MLIKDIFLKRIDRPINGVIKVGQDDQANVRQELEEYVVTKELAKHFRSFFDAYRLGIDGRTDKMGVWISGFFGSGKSHFLKILSYLLANKDVDGKRAIEYFTDDRKITDERTLENMLLAGSVPTDVILFNIDSKSEMSGKQAKDAIVSVFLRVFNEMLGFSGSIPHLADLERKLTEIGKYEDFMARMEAVTGQPWSESRNDFDFIQDDVVEVLSAMDFMTVEAARNWCEKAVGPYNISIEDFAKMVKKHIDRKGNNHHVVFLVDEIGQYIGDDSNLMLNLQTVTEDLGRICEGKAWVVVTSQQDVGSIAKIVSEYDFSKIAGRFDTRISLSSADVNEVIRKRILEKDRAAGQSLGLLYDDINTKLANIILFTDDSEKKLYAGREDFAQVYPFIPYQFDLLVSVLPSVRNRGTRAKHLSEGERSMLSMFQRSAVRVMNEETGILVPFYMFYDALEENLDSSHSGVISRALRNDHLNPGHAEECFDVNVLKVLYLIKGVKEITANAEQITSLMVTGIDEDRLSLKKRVEQALDRLRRETLIEKNGDSYVFLTDEEQEVNRQIERQAQSIEQNEIIGKVSELIFDSIYDEKKYRYPAFNGRYQFPFNQTVDNRPHKANQNYDITLRILTPYSDEDPSDQTLRLISGQSCCVLVVLPDDDEFLQEIRTAKSIEKFLLSESSRTLAKYETVKAVKQKEMRDRSERAKLYLQEALKNAAIYVAGDRLNIASQDIKTRINEAMGKLVAQVYHKLSYIDTPVDDAAIRALLAPGSAQVRLEGPEGSPNKLALDEMEAYITTITARHAKTSMKSLTDRFIRAPYGFTEQDIQWLAAKLFRGGDIAFYVNNEPISRTSKNPEELFRILTRKEFAERLMMEHREKATDKQKKSVRDVMRTLFGVTSANDEDDELMAAFGRYAEAYRTRLDTLDIHYETQPKYPGQRTVRNARQLISKILAIKLSAEFYATVDKLRDDLLDLAEDMEPVNGFFSGEQKKYFDDSLRLMAIFEDSKTYVADEKLEDVVRQISDILKSPAPYRDIYKLPELNSSFRALYSSILDYYLEPILLIIEKARQRVLDEINEQQCRDEFSGRCVERFAELTEKAKSCSNVAALQNTRIEADTLKVRFLNEISAFVERREASIQAAVEYYKQDNGGEDSPDGTTPDGGSEKTPAKKRPSAPPAPPKPAKKRKTISISSITYTSIWQIENESDINRYLDDLATALRDQLEENTILNIEF